jgi:diacylglycerol kinase family enzyme
LPIGTSNVFARELGLSVPGVTGRFSVEAGLAYLRTAVVRPVDLGMCNGIPFLLWAGIGLDGFLVHRIEPRQRWEKRLGGTYYAVRAASQARAWKGQALQIQTDETTLEGQFILAVFTNIRLYAGGVATLSPQSRMDDGLMELWLFGGDNLYHILRHAGNLISGRHLKSQQVQCYSVRQTTLQSAAPLYLQLDGDPFEGEQRVELKVMQHGLKLLVPPETPATLFSDAVPSLTND